MKRIALTVLLLAIGCAEPPKQNRAILYYQGLEDLWKWHPTRGGAGDPAYEGLLSLDPPDSVPQLIRGLSDLSATKIDDNIHPPPAVGDICFFMLLTVFNLSPKDFDREGVWVSKTEDNMIYAVHIDSPEIRRRIAAKFTRLATERKWTGQP